MSFRLKLLLAILVAAVIPLSISAFTALTTHQQAFDGLTRQSYRSSAHHGATLTQRYLDGARDAAASLARTIEWTRLSPEEMQGAQWLVYGQHDDALVVSVLDERGGGAAPSAFVEGASDEHAAHPSASIDALRAFAEAIPFRTARDGSVAVGAPFFAESMESPAVALGIGIDGVKPSQRWVVAVGLSLRTLCRDIISSPGEGVDGYLLDEQGRILCGPPGVELLTKFAAPTILDGAGGAPVITYEDAAGRELVAAVATLPNGWAVLVQQPTDVAFAASRDIELQSAIWIGLSLLLGLAVAFLLSRSVTRPVARLTEGAEQLAKGNFGHRIRIDGRDELAKLSTTFNHMGKEVEARDAEIRSWNEQLQQRVDERTQALRDAQKQLLQSQKLAAMASLGAGVAHEINNPLTAVVGLTQVMLRKERKAEGKSVKLLENIESEALRIKGIVSTLQTMSERPDEEGFIEVDLNDVLGQVLEMMTSDIEAAGATVVRELSNEPLVVSGSTSELQQVFVQLLRNSLKAFRTETREITIRSELVEGQVVLAEVRDTGRGIPAENLGRIFDPFFTTKDDWQGEGLGLSVAYRIVQKHQGEIRPTSELDKGTSMIVTLPRYARAHLE